MSLASNDRWLLAWLTGYFIRRADACDSITTVPDRWQETWVRISFLHLGSKTPPRTVPL
ncbi:uncharacterized protein MELLADRAFT_75461 [Melampsora larici-populina 98AG31]|uniref:Uncharacterized protein n=1 Tax=Melampsora larici-populina (strain 98AG31 / pathotype 3-4-7) TaxID=747676 RepID=F4RYR3_MELLP|nr:uncharacterized protein MELLADRAFT_75461 [Melampsora larici-populina 98AG31]EGG02531.1 hypothetical protein MELLADRAFT_75461 [Melampsora larici-populina 98AG31]